MSNFDIAWTWCMIGFLMGNALAYFLLYRPVLKLKNDYIDRLHERLRSK